MAMRGCLFIASASIHLVDIQTMARVPWSSLPPDLIILIADCFLDSNDLDWYMNLRAVCQTWRASTMDPKMSQHTRFRPSTWIMLDETPDTETRLFVKLTTGRFLHRQVPQLRRLDLITSIPGGFLVVADTRQPHAVHLLNPFTGAMTHFSAPVPRRESRLAAAVVGSSPILVLASIESDNVYWADPHSDSFRVQRYYSNPAQRLPLIAGKYGFGSEESNNRIHDKTFEDGYLYLIPESAGGAMLLAIFSEAMDVFRLDVYSGELVEQVNDIGNRAVFLGERCFIVDAADRFPSVDANCIYLEQCYGSCSSIIKCNIGNGEEEIVAEGIDGQLRELRSGPFTLLQLLSRYAMDVPKYYRLNQDDP